MRPLILLVAVCFAGCGGGGGSGSAGAGGVIVFVPPPNLNFTADNSTVRQGEAVRLSWSTTSADSCTASGAWSGSRAVNGSEILSNLQQSASYTLTCANTAGSVVRTVDVTVTPVTPQISLTITPTLVERGAELTVTWSAPWATECVGQWAVFGTPPPLAAAGSLQLPIPANWSGTTFGVSMLCSNANGAWTAGTEAAVKTLSGEIHIPAGIYVDTDVNDPNAEYVSNDVPVTELPVYGVVPGYVNVAGQGPAGRSFAAGDPWDYFFITSDRAGQVARLRLPTVNTSVAPAERDDADLYLYDRDSGALVDASISSNGEELIALPGMGHFVVGVKAERGGFNYVLSFDDPPVVSGSGVATLASEFVPGEAIVTMETHASSAGMSKLSGEAGHERLVRFASAASTVAASVTQKSNRPWFGQKAAENLSSAMREKLATLQEIKRLSQLEGVRHASVNRILHAQLTPTDPLFARQRWHYEAARLPAAWDITTGSSDVIVAGVLAELGAAAPMRTVVRSISELPQRKS